MREQYPDDNYVFWAGSASAHYAKKVIALLDSINYVLKVSIMFLRKITLLTVLRPVKDFWDYLKGLVYMGKCETKLFKN